MGGVYLFLFFLFKAADLKAALESRAPKHTKIKIGQLLPHTSVQFEKAESSPINLIGKSKGYENS